MTELWEDLKEDRVCEWKARAFGSFTIYALATSDDEVNTGVLEIRRGNPFFEVE